MSDMHASPSVAGPAASSPDLYLTLTGEPTHPTAAGRGARVRWARARAVWLRGWLGSCPLMLLAAGALLGYECGVLGVVIAVTVVGFALASGWSWTSAVVEPGTVVVWLFAPLWIAGLVWLFAPAWPATGLAVAAAVSLVLSCRLLARLEL